MATITEKVKAFFDLLGESSAEEVASAARMIQKNADDIGAEYKEADTPAEAATDESETVKAKKKPAPPKVEIEIEAEGEGMEGEEEGMEGEEEVMEEEEGMKPAKKKDDSDLDLDTFLETESEEGLYDLMEDGDEDFFALGDVDVKEYSGIMAEVLTEALNPIVEAVAELRKDVTALKELSQKPDQMAQKELQGVVLALQGIQEHEDRLDKIATTVAATAKKVKELSSDTPRFMQGFIASESADTEVSEEKAKELGAPTVDPKVEAYRDFLAFAIPQAAPKA